MVSKQILKKVEKDDFYIKNNLICPRCISNYLKVWVKTKTKTNDFSNISKVSKEIDWIVNKNKFLEESKSNSECSVCGKKTVYIHHKHFIDSVSDILSERQVSNSSVKEFESYFKKDFLNKEDEE